MVVEFSGPGGSGGSGGAGGPAVAEGVYPGGQSENPASPWYDDLISRWWSDQTLPMITPGRPAGSLRWTLDRNAGEGTPGHG
jgi:acyl-homoserine lactone acylase PvdQ